MIGTSIAQYTITAKLGQGGMGEVYRATDTKLDREVAIKVLPEAVANDKERLARFEREAKVLAQLNHPNIAAVFGLEHYRDTQALVLELVEGDDLSQRLKDGALTVEESLEICRQIAEALDSAHQKGIMHRDLKPGNIKLTDEGRVKVLDFGLAKALTGDSDVTTVSNTEDSPTITDAFTKPGTILGTAAYMSPEQARGKPLDKRTDIWAFGCVFYECLTGKRAFQGEDVAETLAKIIQGHPDWDRLPSSTTPSIQLLLRKCLAKKRSQRLRDIGDAVVDIDQASTDPTGSFLLQTEGSQLETKTQRYRSRAFILVSMLVVLTIGAVMGWINKPSQLAPSSSPYYSEIILPGEDIVSIAISPDASQIGFDMWGRRDGIRLRNLDRSRAIKLIDAEESWVMDFSPNGKEIVGVSRTQIWKAGLDGTAAIQLVDLSKNTFPFTAGVSWSEDDVIVYPADFTSGLMKVSAFGGQPEPLTRLKENEKAHSWPQCLPGGRHVLFSVTVTDENHSSQSKQQIAIADMDTGEHRLLPVDQDCIYPRYAHSGHLLYLEHEVLFAVPFDLETLRITGGKVDVLHGVNVYNSGLGQYDLSDDGTLVYKETTIQKEEKTTLYKWLYFDGRIEDVGSIEGQINRFFISPDGSHISVVKTSRQVSDKNRDIWLYELNSMIPMRFTQFEGDDFAPVWSRDMEWIYFRSDRSDGQKGIWRKRAQSPEGKAELVADMDVLEVFPQAISNDGELLFVVIQVDPLNYDIAALDLSAPTVEKKMLKDTPASEFWPSISPNGRWLAYCSDISGKIDVYIAPLATPDTNVRPVSVNGGLEVAWSSSGDRLFYRVQGIGSDTIMVVDVQEDENGLTIHPPKKLLNLPFTLIKWKLDDKNERMLVVYNKDVVDREESLVTPNHNIIRVVSNFFTELNSKASSQ